MRTEKELLQVLLDNMDKFETGLCLLSGALQRGKIITMTEEFSIFRYIEGNAPKMNYNKVILSVYKWPKGEKQPRIDWLNEQIQKLQQNEKT